jgi:hypothetical protein
MDLRWGLRNRKFRGLVGMVGMEGLVEMVGMEEMVQIRP